MVALAGGELHVLASSAALDAWLAVRMVGIFVLVPVGLLLMVMGLLASERPGLRPQVRNMSCGWLMIGGAVVLLVDKPIAALWHVIGSAAFALTAGLFLVQAGLVELGEAASKRLQADKKAKKRQLTGSAAPLGTATSRIRCSWLVQTQDL